MHNLNANGLSKFSGRYVNVESEVNWDYLTQLSYSGGGFSSKVLTYKVRPVIKLNSGVVITGGSGSATEPYTVGI